MNHSPRFPVLLAAAAMGLAASLGARPQPAAAAPPAGPVPVTRKAIDERIATYVNNIWSKLNEDGHWDELQAPAGAGGPPSVRTEYSNYGGQTALMLLALKVAGVDEDDKRFAKAKAFVQEQSGNGTYFRGLRSTLYGLLKDPKCRLIQAEDARFLGNGLILERGGYTYVSADPKLRGDGGLTYGDYSNTQYGVLGVWSASDHGFEVPLKFWRLLEKGYLENQNADGGWGYRFSNAEKPYGSMTAAAVASLYVIMEKAYVVGDANCAGKVNPDLLAGIDHGLDWLGQHFSAVENPEIKVWNEGYYFYALERVGVASGLKYLGKKERHDWYKEVASALINNKVSPYGLHQQAWTLLFLCYGRAPVAVNKLDYGRGWNEHPRDYAMLCRYLARVGEKHRNWQIMPLAAGQDEFHDAPILAMSGRGAFNLKPDEVRKIKTYLLRGGMLFGEAIDSSPNFGGSFKNLCRQMFPNLELVRLGADHPIYSAHARLPNGRPELLGLSDGVRTLVVFSPRDVSCDWQKLNLAAGKLKFEFGDNLVQYASDSGQLWSKEESYWPTDAGKKPAKTLTIGRLIHGLPGGEAASQPAAAPAGAAPSKGDPAQQVEHIWNPSGGTGWQRLDILSRNSGGPGIATVATDLSQPLDPKQTPVLHMTGIGSIVLGPEAKSHLKTYVESGGLLLADAAGGRQPFVDGFTKLCEELFGAGQLAPVPAPQLPFLAQATEGGKTWYRHLERMPRSLRPLELLGVNVKQADGKGNWNVLFLPCDLTYALVGAPASDPVGLEPAAAEKLVLAVLNSRAGGN